MALANNLEQAGGEIAGKGRKGNHVVDNFCDFVGTVVGGPGIELHDGWIYPFVAGACGSGADN